LKLKSVTALALVLWSVSETLEACASVSQIAAQHEATAHIGQARREPDPDAGSRRDHSRRGRKRRTFGAGAAAPRAGSVRRPIYSCSAASGLGRQTLVLNPKRLERWRFG
jgi:hypothetical protein